MKLKVQSKKNIVELSPYVCARDLYKEGLFLDANEFPNQWFNPNFKGIGELNRYPDSTASKLREKLSQNYLDGIATKKIFVGAGSDEIIDLLIRAFVEPYEKIMVMNPSYSIYKVQASINNVETIKIPLTSSFNLDLESIGLNMQDVKIVFLCSPNNPTGKLISREELIAILDFADCLVVVDEAYIEFAGLENSALDLVSKYPNLIILRTFSKAWGLAGIRVGYSISSEDIVDTLMKIKDSYNVSLLAQEVALQVLDFVPELRKQVDYLNIQKKNLIKNLRNLGLNVQMTDANFLLIKIENASEIVSVLAQRGVIVRDRSSEYLLNNTIRISIGTKEQNDILLRELEKLI